MKRSLLSLAILLMLAPVAWASNPGPLQPSRVLDFNGVHIAAYEGSGTRGPGVLLIHGNTAAADYYAKTLRSLLASQRRVVAIDLPGYGNSDDAPAYNIGYFASAIQFAAQALGVDHGVVVGWSLGGDLALQASHLLPNVQGYFLVGTAPFGYAPDLPSPFLSPDESYAGVAVTYGFVPGLTEAQIVDLVTAFFRPGYTDIPAFLYDDSVRADPATRAAVAAAAFGLDPTVRDEVAIVKALTVPVALVVGGDDAFVNPAYLAGLAPQVPTLWKHRFIELPDTGHAVQWERPVAFHLLLEAFLRDLP